ncbi:hypothetical protein K2Z84_30635 [Candidatus Binatia bacterium]|nr:hypothetical protein [Candidatus Binatia bacterium]
MLRGTKALSRRKRIHLVAAAVYLSTALWLVRSVLPAPATRLAHPARQDGVPGVRAIANSDHMNEASAMLRSAYLWPRAPQRLLEGDCYPLSQAGTRGEHMIGEGLAAAIPYAVSGEPILAYNVVVVAWLAVAGVAMYALVFHWSRSTAAALVAGLVFLLQPIRSTDPQHLFIHADHWTPLVLLFLHRLLRHGRWHDVIWLCAAATLQLLASAYNVLEAAVVVGVCGTAMAAHHRRSLPRLLPKLATAAAILTVVAVLTFTPFVRMRATWPTSQHFSLPLPLVHVLPGGIYFPGWIALALATVALLDRVVRRRGSEDPRLPMLCAGVLCFWAAAAPLPLPWGGQVPSPVFALIALGPLSVLKDLRGLNSIAQGMSLAFAFLAGFGVMVLARRAPPRLRLVVPAVASAAVVAQALLPALSRPTFGLAPTDMTAVALRPAQPVLDLMGGLAPGPVLDLPFAQPQSVSSMLDHTPHYALLRTYHQRRIAGCATSLRSPLETDVGALSARLPGDQRAADALYALGFRNVVVHEEFLPPRKRAEWEAASEAVGTSTRLQPLGRAEEHAAFRLDSPTPVAASFDALGPGGNAEPELRVERDKAVVPFAIRNRGAATYRHPDPVEPTNVIVRWRGAAGESSFATRTLLPLALASGEQILRDVETPVPASPGRYQVTLELQDPPRTVLARRTVEFAASGG